MAVDWKFLDEVFTNIMKMPIGGEKELNIRHRNHSKFIENVRFIIDNEYDIKNGFELTFNTDCSKLYKKEWAPGPYPKRDMTQRIRRGNVS